MKMQPTKIISSEYKKWLFYSEVAKFQNEIKPLDDKVIQNTNQIKILENMRDTLFPKFMSGEIRLKDI